MSCDNRLDSHEFSYEDRSPTPPQQLLIQHDVQKLKHPPVFLMYTPLDVVKPHPR